MSAPSEEDLAVLREAFEEASDILERVGSSLDHLDGAPNWRPLLDEVYRGVHTLKGNSAALGWQRAARAAHAIEADIAALVKGELPPTSEKVRAMRSAVDELEAVLREQAETTDRLASHPPAIEAAHTPAPPALAVPPVAAPPIPAPRAEALTPAVGLHLPALKAPRPAAITIAGLPQQSAPIVAEPPPASAGPQSLAAGPRSALFQEGQESLRVPVGSVNGALNHIWEVFLLRSQIAYLFEEHREALRGAHAFVQAWEPLDGALRRHVTELETVVMSMRLMTLRGLFSRMQQVVRAYASQHPEKSVHLHVSGDDIQVDKRVLDRLGEPFVHLVRNAIDHGIEPSADRLATGKARAGVLGIHAEATADRILIRVSDDGRGIRADKLLAKARERGLDVSGIATEEDAIELIFRPGFSTADQITGVSGRGVGMDAVRSSITELGGSVSVETNPGHGTTFLVTLPVSVSIVPVVLLDVNGETYASHVGGVIEVCRIPAAEVVSTSGEPMFRFHDRFIRCVDLRARMHGEPSSESEAAICVVRRGSVLLGLRVSRVLATTEVVVKPLPALSPVRPYVHGVSILPTGQAIFVLSLEQLADHLFVHPASGAGGQTRVAA